MPGACPTGPVGVELRDVRFHYPAAGEVSLASLEEVAVLDDTTNEEVLHGVSVTVEPGQTVALVGSSGAGKSTLASLVPRLYDVNEGGVRLGGVDVRDLTFDSLRETVGVVTQDGHLFHDTIRANLHLRPPRRHRRRPVGRARPTPGWATWSPPCPTASTRWSANAATACRAASASA